jgi:ubiquinone/menaquinone biosynthesis C-methylase UbiE
MLDINHKLKINFKNSFNKSWENWQEKWDDKRVDNIWGEKLRKAHWERDLGYRIVAEVSKKHGENVLDIGAGGGVQYAAIKKYTPEVKYTGVDITPRHIQFARKFFPDVKFEEGDAANLKYSDNFFDVSIVRHVIEHHPIEKAERILSEAFRVAKNCVLILFFITPEDMKRDVKVKRKKNSGFYLNTYSKKWLHYQIEKYGFSYKTIPIKKKPESSALYDQTLYTCVKQ